MKLKNPLAVETKDDQGDSTECVNAMNALISDGIQLVVGSATSGCTSATTSVANSEGTVMITPSGTADSLTTAMDYVFRTCFRDSFQGELAAQYAKDEGYTKVGIVYCSADTYSAGLRDAFTAACGDKGLEIVAEESVASMAEVDYTNQFNKMVSARAELVFTPFYYDVMGPYLVPPGPERRLQRRPSGGRRRGQYRDHHPRRSGSVRLQQRLFCEPLLHGACLQRRLRRLCRKLRGRIRRDAQQLRRPGL